MPNYNELLREHKDARKAAQAYVDWCTERGYTPKFAKFANHPNYYKLLEDFTTMVDGKYAPQEAVTFTFPTEESAFGGLESLIEQGLEEDAVLEGQRDVKVDAIVEEVGEVLGVQPKFSLQASAEELAEIEAERQSIIETAKANGTYLKAPNGKDTNLTPEQWVNVRTSRFKKWFGDWENDPRNASKIVDENGEPMVMIHGSQNTFTIFRRGQKCWLLLVSAGSKKCTRGQS